MVKWQATLSTTEPYNYVGIINVRQGNKNTEVLEVTITENSLLLDLTDSKVFLNRILIINFRFNDQQKS